MFSNIDQEQLQHEEESQSLDRAFRNFTRREHAKIISHGNSTRPIPEPDTREVVILLIGYGLNNIPHLLPYMREMIQAAGYRIFKYRYHPHMLSFSDNEKIMLHRLYEVIK